MSTRLPPPTLPVATTFSSRPLTATNSQTPTTQSSSHPTHAPNPITTSTKRIQKLKTIITYIGNVTAALAALAATYTALQVAVWTAAKEYRDDCRGQYETFNTMSKACENALHHELVPPLGLATIIGDNSKRDSLSGLTDSKDSLQWQHAVKAKSPFTYFCFFVLTIDVVLKFRKLFICLLDSLTESNVEGNGDEFSNVQTSQNFNPGQHELLVESSVPYQRMSHSLPPLRQAISIPPQVPDHNNRLTLVGSPASYAYEHIDANDHPGRAVLHQQIGAAPMFPQQASSFGEDQDRMTRGIRNIPDQFPNLKRRGNMPKPVTDVLRDWFTSHLDHPYPAEEDKQMFIAKTGLTINQISNWFINARRRHWPALKAQRENRGSTTESDYRMTTLQF